MRLYGDGGCGIQYVIAKDTKCRIIIIARHFVTVECGFAVTVMRITLYILYTVRQLETPRPAWRDCRPGARGGPGSARVQAGPDKKRKGAGKTATLS